MFCLDLRSYQECKNLSKALTFAIRGIKIYEALNTIQQPCNDLTNNHHITTVLRLLFCTAVDESTRFY